MKQLSLIDTPGQRKITFPVLDVQMVPIEKIVANNYNPNSVAPPEMRLLKLSIEEDGYTQPIVCFHDQEQDRYIIVDGFHRYRCGKECWNLSALPVVIIDKPLSERMASTIRHNRARGKHAIEPMSDLVAALTQAGWSAARIAKELGMDADEVLRLQQAVGLPEMFANRDYSKSWEGSE